ncbi:hypothetical protein AN7072.2 [Aspergillus nidulans FGSC A4]|uniref:Miscellaneous Zn(II)2Cys6 transcription factor (Eurofung) n=1 Tax=Emericella nidulans (strain FGSC A4 / ATCC 38163 / CBS 112.46 / NRRL 194 / M139) TaxID=227321 RepID=Q5AXA8_EMENI|nr:hypothetical protein [Aspergillus nidulans FGSC A4]EAA61201.1 hypothetical protein AN7072.2 [Aspergillus nidulans FGSC A4]CBF79141.1 TPA: Miscellaneous Zn(II)2Cys6 transcription factor (Eurofung) [Aspergillus nidulans FGSC A4]|eukprot:XP_664676.1 hypothetical protein AN7072.2 [Aspergillus nidulans FGSC A4]
MELPAESELQYAGECLSLPGTFLEPPIEDPPSSVLNLLNLSQVDFNSYDFSSLGSREFSSKWQTNTPLCTDSLSDESAPGLLTEDMGISPIPMPAAEATCPQESEDRLCRNPQGRCISLATGILGSMHAGSNSCILQVATSDQGGASDRQPQQSRAADAILSMNQSALRTVRSILNCSCYESPQVLLLVTVMCSRITAWYWRIADIYSYSHGNPTAGSPRAALPTSVGSRAETRRRDFFIGNHRLDREVETVVIRHVLLGMLQELQLVIRDFAGQAGQSPAGTVDTDDPTSTSDLMLSGMRARVVAFLRKQLHSLTSALDHTDSGFGTMGPHVSHY